MTSLAEPHSFITVCVCVCVGGLKLVLIPAEFILSHFSRNIA